jgi:hypothetical protein
MALLVRVRGISNSKARIDGTFLQYRSRTFLRFKCNRLGYALSPSKEALADRLAHDEPPCPKLRLKDRCRIVILLLDFTPQIV